MGKKQRKVLLLAHTLDVESLIAKAVQLCTSASGFEELLEAPNKASDLTKCFRRMCSIEHGTFTFALEGISNECAHQFRRHRIASFSHQSQKDSIKRRKDQDTFGYILPSAIAADPETKQIFEKLMREVQNTHDLLIEKLTKQGVAPEVAVSAAGSILPNACETRMIVTMNARELRHFFNKRGNSQTETELVLVARDMLKLAKQSAPTLFAGIEI